MAMKVIEFIKSLFHRRKEKTIKLSTIKAEYSKYKDQLIYIERRKPDLDDLGKEYYRLKGVKKFLSLGEDSDVVSDNMKLLIHGDNVINSLYLNLEDGKLYLGNDTPIRSIREFLKMTVDGIYKNNYFDLVVREQKDLKKLWKKYENIFKV